MAKAAKNVACDENLSYDDMIKILKAVKGTSASYIGKREITSAFTSKRIRTGIPTIDFLSSGGITRGRITIYAGNISSSKTTQSLQIVAAAQKVFKAEGLSKMTLWYDVEGAYDAARAEQLGVDQNLMIVKRGKVIEEVFSEIDDLISTGLIGFLVIDSLDALIARKVDDSDYGNTMGGASGAVAMHLPKLFNKIMDHEVTTILIKQCREKMNAQNLPIITFNGGKALRHFADSIFMVNRLSNKDMDYVPINVKAEKTRSSRMGLGLVLPLGEKGIDIVRDAVTLSIERGVLNQAGAWLNFTLNGEELKFQGIGRLITFFKENPDKFSIFCSEVLDKVIFTESIVGASAETLTVVDED